MSPNEIHDKILTLGEDWAELNWQAQVLEETRKSLLAEIQQEFIQKGKSATAAEPLARLDERYTDHVTEMCRLRKEANKARVKYDTARCWSDHVRQQVANRRAGFNDEYVA